MDTESQEDKSRDPKETEEIVTLTIACGSSSPSKNPLSTVKPYNNDSRRKRFTKFTSQKVPSVNTEEPSEKRSLYEESETPRVRKGHSYHLSRRVHQ